MKKVMMLSFVLLLGSMASADVVLDDFTGLDGVGYASFRGISWQAPDTMINTTNTRGGQLIISNWNANAGSLGYDETADVAVMKVTLKPAANNTLLGLGLIMIKDDLDRRFMFLFNNFVNPTSNQWETISSYHSYRDAAQGLATGEFNWSAVTGAWIQCWTQQGNHNPQWITNVQFDAIKLKELTARGGAHTPVPTGVDIDSQAYSSVSWYNWEQDKDANSLDDPNITAITGYDVYWSETEPNYLTDSPVSVNQPGQSYTPAGGINYETTYYWRVDAHVTWDSNSFTGTDSLSSIVEGQEWEFTTLPSYIPPTVTFNNVHTTVDFLPAELSATVSSITLDSFPLNKPVFTWLTDGVDFPAGATAVLVDTTGSHYANPTATLEPNQPGTYQVLLQVDDGTTYLEAIAEVVIYEDLCQAAKDAPDGYTQLAYDFNNNCYVDLSDFALFAAGWLNDALLNDQQSYSGTVQYVPQDVYEDRIDACIPRDPNACSDAPITDTTGIRVEITRPNATDSTNLGSAGAAAWVEYLITIDEGTYNVYAGYSLAGTTASVMTMGTEAEPAKYGTLNFPVTGSWDNFWPVLVGKVTFTESGEQIIRTTYSAGFNLDWFSFDPQ